jgi:hypothetical protein
MTITVYYVPSTSATGVTVKVDPSLPEEEARTLAIRRVRNRLKGQQRARFHALATYVHP